MTALDIGILLGATVLRLALNTVTDFSPADENVMRALGVQASDPSYSYRRACERWFSEPHYWKWPGVLRFGNIFLLGALYRLTLSSSFRVMTSVSTAASIATVWLSWLIAAKVAPGTETAVAALVATSPLGLHLGRRALQDAQSCALTLGTITAALYGHPIVGALALAFMVASKETTLTHVAPIAIFLALAGVPLWTVALVLVVGGCFYLVTFAGVGGDFRIFWKYPQAVKAAKQDSYGRYQEGGIHRLIVDLVLLGPFVVLCAARGWHTGAPLNEFVFWLVLTHSALPVLQSVRMVASAEVMLRIAAAAVMPVYLLPCALALDAALFFCVFAGGRVYDPVTANLVSALGMAPKANA